MTRRASWLALGAFLLTFGWMLLPGDAGAVALWPSALAILLAFVTRNIHASLLLGAFAGAVLLAEGNVLRAFLDLFERHLLPALSNDWNISVLVFTLMMGGLVELMSRGGGMEALASRFLRGAETKRRAGLGVYGLGWVLFIDGLANAMLVGRSMRPIADRVGMSREKLAFIVDSTSSPIAGLSVVSTWVAYELSVIQSGLDIAGRGEMAAFPLLLESIPYRFYNIFLLLIVFLVIILGRDIGPMRTVDSSAKRIAEEAPGEGAATRVWPTLVSLGVLIGGVFAGLYLHGGGAPTSFSLNGMIDAFGKANAALVFVWATAAAILVAMILQPFNGRQAEHGQSLVPVLEGMQRMFLPALILVLAWTLNSVIGEMDAAGFLASLLGDTLHPAWLPAMTFLLGAIISFSTGTSWGTMAILMPLVIPVALAMPDGQNTALVPVVGAVLAGAVFGDHCSPISDTTIVSAVSCDCEPMSHVRTQLPYAMIAATGAIVFGCLPAGFGVPWWISLSLGGLAAWWLFQRLDKSATTS